MGAQACAQVLPREEIPGLLRSYPSGINLPYLFRRVLYPRFKDNGSDKEKKALYKRLYRVIKKYESEGLISIEKIDGLLWVSHARAPINLIADPSVSQTFQTSRARVGDPEEPVDGAFEGKREKALDLLSHSTYLVGSRKELLEELFTENLEDIHEKRIILRLKDPSELGGLFIPSDIPKYRVLPYITRFNSGDRIQNNMANFDKAWDFATKLYKIAVILTLTTDPKNFSGLKEQIEAIMVNFNRFMSFITRRLEFRPKYICVLEFSEKGYPHLHIVFFNIKWLMKGSIISEIWEKYGQGKIIKIKSLKNFRGRWVYWDEEGKKRDARDYLRKYLSKNQSIMREVRDYLRGSIEYPSIKGLFKIALYWACNKRFFTCSRGMVVNNKEKRGFTIYKFFGVFYYDEIPTFILLECVYQGVRDMDGV